MSILKQNLLKAGLVLAVFISLNLVAKAMAPPIPYDPVADVYQIYTPAQLAILAEFVADEDSNASAAPTWTSRGKTFVLMNDIDGFSKSIGTYGHPFMGRFDGNGHKITLARSTSVLSDLNAGVFGCTDGAFIENLTVAGYIECFDSSASGNPVESIG